MKNKILIVLLCILFIGCSNKGKSQNLVVSLSEKQKKEKTPKEVITAFYNEYITLQDQPPSNENKANVGSIIEKYLTKELATRIKKSSLDYDPLINAQDVSLNWLKTLKVKEIDSSKLKYSVCYLSSYDNSKKCIDLKVISVEGIYKIGDILDENISSSVSSHKNGVYSYHIEPVGDPRTAISFYVEMNDSEIVFKRESYSNTFQYECLKQKKDNKIQLFYKATIEGKDQDSSNPLITIFKKGAKYYAISSLIEDGKEIELIEE